MNSLIKMAALIGLIGLFTSAQAETASTAAPKAAPTEVSEGTDLKVEIKVGTDVSNLEVVGEGDSFPVSVERLVGWTLVTGAAQPTEIVHAWIYKGNEISTVTLQVKSSRFRTFSRKTVTGMPGEWTLQVKDSTGQVLATKDVTVTSDEEKSTPAKEKAAPAEEKATPAVAETPVVPAP